MQSPNRSVASSRRASVSIVQSADDVASALCPGFVWAWFTTWAGATQRRRKPPHNDGGTKGG